MNRKWEDWKKDWSWKTRFRIKVFVEAVVLESIISHTENSSEEGTDFEGIFSFNEGKWITKLNWKTTIDSEEYTVSMK